MQPLFMVFVGVAARLATCDGFPDRGSGRLTADPDRTVAEDRTPSPCGDRGRVCGPRLSGVGGVVVFAVGAVVAVVAVGWWAWARSRRTRTRSGRRY